MFIKRFEFIHKTGAQKMKVIRFLILSIILLFHFNDIVFAFTVSIQSQYDYEENPFRVDFNSVISNGGIPPFEYVWHFGDQTASTIDKPIHIYSQSGMFDIWVAVRDAANQFAYASQTLVIMSEGQLFESSSFTFHTTHEPVHVIVPDTQTPHILWIGTQAGLMKLNLNTHQKTWFFKQLPCAVINDMTQSIDSTLWIATCKGVVKWMPSQTDWNVFDTSNSIIPIDAIHCIFSANDGTIWIGTNKGLVSFHPITLQWQLYQSKPDGLPSNNITDITQSSDGSLWVGTEDGLAQLNLKTNQWKIFTPYNSGLPDFYITDILVTLDQSLWVGTWKGGVGFYQPESESWTYYNASNSPMSHNYISSLILDQSNTLWVGTWGSGLMTINTLSTECQALSMTTYGAMKNIYSLCFGPNASIIATTDNRLIQFKKPYDIIKEYQLDFHAITDHTIQTIIQTANDDIWIATKNKGVMHYNFETFQTTHYTFANSDLPDNHVNYLTEFFDRSLWIGTNNGLAFIESDGQTWHIYSKLNGLPDNTIKSVIQTFNGDIWVGTMKGLARKKNNATDWQIFTPNNSGLPGLDISSLLLAFDGALWVGTTQEGIARFDIQDNNWESFTTKKSNLTDNQIHCLAQTFDNHIWIGTAKGGLNRFNYEMNQWQTYITMPGLHTLSDIRSLYSDSNYVIWIGSATGQLVQFDYLKNNWTLADQSNTSLPAYPIQSICRKSDSELLLGTYGAGICQFQMPGQEISPGKLIIITGKNSSGTCDDPLREMTTMVYEYFNAKGFHHQDIYCVSRIDGLDINGDGIHDQVLDAPLNSQTSMNESDIQLALTDWAIKRYESGKLLYIYIIGEGTPNFQNNGPAFYLEPDQILYAKQLDAMMTSYERLTGGQIICITQFSFANQFVNEIKNQGRILVIGGSNLITLEDLWATNSFTYEFIKQLYKNNNLFQAVNNTIHSMIDKTGLTDTGIMLDDTGDGVFNDLDGQWASQIKVGADSPSITSWPSIQSVSAEYTSGQMTISASVSSQFAQMWAYIYMTDTQSSQVINGCIEENYQLVDLMEESTILSSHNLYHGIVFDLPDKKTYQVRVIAKDYFGRVSRSNDIVIMNSSNQLGKIQGQIQPYVPGFDISIQANHVQILVQETNDIAFVASDGLYTLDNLEPGDYTLTVSGPSFKAFQIKDVSVQKGVVKTLPKISIPVCAYDTCLDSDLSFELKDAIMILKKLTLQNN